MPSPADQARAEHRAVVEAIQAWIDRPESTDVRETATRCIEALDEVRAKAVTTCSDGQATKLIAQAIKNCWDLADFDEMASHALDALSAEGFVVLSPAEAANAAYGLTVGVNTDWSESPEMAALIDKLRARTDSGEGA